MTAVGFLFCVNSHMVFKTCFNTEGLAAQIAAKNFYPWMRDQMIGQTGECVNDFGFSPHCVFLHEFSVNLVDLAHWSQLNGLSPVWILKWMLRDQSWEKWFFYKLHGFSPVWVLRWARKWVDWEDVLPHWGQRRCFFLVCFPVWLLRRPSMLKDSEHSGHLNAFLAESSFAAVRALSEVSSLLCCFASTVKQFN
jgi:hypothetical protein